MEKTVDGHYHLVVSSDAMGAILEDDVDVEANARFTFNTSSQFGHKYTIELRWIDDSQQPERS